MKRYWLPVCAIALALTVQVSASAQEKQKEKEKWKDKTRVDEYDEIIIKKKDDSKNGKVIIEFKDGDVMVDGKTLDEYEGDDVIVRRQSPGHFNLTFPRSPFRENGGWAMEDGEDRAFLGVYTTASDGGAKISSVTENSAAEKAGLKKGDIITKIDDINIEDQDDLSDAIGKYKPDEKVTITYKRDNKENKLTVALGKRKSASMAVVPRIHAMPELNREFNFNFDNDLNFENGELNRVFSYGGRPRLGIRAQDTEDGKGVKVLDVIDESPADKAGVRENDIITDFDGKAVNSADELADAAKDSKDKTSFKLQLKRDGKAQTVEVKIPKKLKTANL